MRGVLPLLGQAGVGKPAEKGLSRKVSANDTNVKTLNL